MRRYRRMLAVLAAGAVPWLASAAAAADAAAFDPATVCALPEEMDTTELPLPHVAEKLKAGEPVRIVVVGSGSSARLGEAAEAGAYPERLAGELQKLFPAGHFLVSNLSRRGRLANEMAARFAADVAPLHPALVIWQTGTVDAVRGVDLGSFGQELENGIDALRALGADVILVNMQYSPHTTAALDMSPYRDYMRWAVQSRSAILFHRYSMMKYWVEEGLIDFSSEVKADQARNDELAHACLAYHLAREIESAVKSGPPE